MCGLILFKKEDIDILNNNLDKYFDEISNYKLEEYKMEEKDNKDNKDDKLRQIYYNKFEQYINELNTLCQQIEKDLILQDIGACVENNLEGTDISQLLNL